MLISFFGTLAAMSLAAVAALRTAPTVAVPCGTTYTVGVLGPTVNWTAAPWSPAGYPGQTTTDDCAVIQYGIISLTGTTIQVAGLDVTSTGVASRLDVGSGGNLNIIGDGLLSSTSAAPKGQLWITGGSVTISSGTQNVNNNGEILVNNGGNLTTLATGGLAVNSGGVLTVGQTGSPGVITAANNGIKIGAGAFANIDNGTLDGAGAWTVGETVIGPTAQMTVGSPGPVLIDGPTINVDQSGMVSVVTSTSGPLPVTLDNGASIDVNNNGTLQFTGSGASPTLQQGVGGGQVDVAVGGAVISTVNGIANLPVNNGGSVTVNGAGNLALNGGGAHNAGVFSNNSSTGTLTLSGNHVATSSLLTGIGAIANAGSLDLDGSTISGTGTFSNTGTMDFFSGTVALDTRSVQNPGLLQWSGASVVLENGASIINTATFDITSDSTMIQGAGAAGTFSNPGTVQKTAGGAISTIGIAFTNTGSVDVQSGTIALTGGGSSTGSHTINSSSVLKIGGGSYTMSGGASVGGSGFFDLAAGTLTLNTTAAFQLPHFSQGGGILTGPATLQILSGGTWNWTGGTQLGSGASTIVDSGAVVNIGVSNKVLDGRSLTNDGSINWLGSTLTLANGAPFVNGSTGAIVINGSVPLMMDTVTGGSFQNDGLVQKLADTGTTSINTIPVLNNGSLDIQTGILNITGTYSSGPSSSVLLTIAGNTVGTGYSQLSLAPNPTLDGFLQVGLGAYTPVGGDTFRLLAIPTGTHTGDFASKSFPPASPGTVWTDAYDANGLLLTAQAVTTSAVVTNLNDSGPGSLRQALTDAAGGFCNPCTITFNIPVPGPIPVLSLLPAPATPIIIDATTQPGYAGTPIVGVDGTPCTGCEGLHLQGSSALSGLAVYNFNGGGGVELEGTGSNTVTNNWLGIDLSGAAAPNVFGAFIDNSSGNTISNNVISGNNFGVYGTGASNNTITNNFIGTGPGGTGSIGNTFGVLLDTTSTQNVVMSNTIANNTNGVTVFDPGSTGNGIKMNSMFANGMGIDLNDDGVSANDAGDGDSGANGTQNFPVISAVAPGIGTDTVTLSVDSSATAAGSLRVEVFKADTFGQGQTFLGQQCFAGNSITSQNMVLSSNLMGGDSIVSTATSYSDGACTTAMDGTSEFSAAFAVVCPTPVIAITAPPNVCPSATAAASVTAIAGATYSWSISNGTIVSGAGTNAITFTAGATGSVTLSVMVTSDCGAVNSTSANVPITPATATITASGPTTFCQGGSVVLTANAASSYLWSTGATTQSIVVSTAGSYSVTVTNAGGCSATSSPVTVTVNPAPVATISGPASMCQAGGSVTLTVGGSNISSILWSNGATTPSITVSPTSTTTYSVMVTSSAGCSTSLSHTVSVGTGGPALTVLAPASVVAFSSGNTASVLGAPAGIYTWVLFNGQITAGEGTPSITFTAGASGMVSIAVTVEDGSGCASNGAVNVPIDACSTTPPSLVSPGAGANVSSPVTFSWSPVGGATGYDVWRVNDGSTPAFVGSSNTTSLTAGVPSGTFSWFVTARLPQACSPAQLESELRRITVVPSTSCPTAAPVLISPTSGSAFSPVRFDWEGVAGALGYRLMASLGGLPAAEIDTTDAGTTEVLADLPVGSVRWWVEAIYPGCPPVSSAFANFSVELEECFRHGAATLIGPSDGATAATSAVTFSWTAVDGADGYAVWVALDEGLSVVGTTVGDLSLTVIIPPGSHEWFVETKFEGCPSTESTRRVINIQPRTNCATSGPSLSSPAQNATVTSPLVTFSWTAVPDAVLYELFLSVAGGSPALIGTATTTSLTAEVPPGEIEWFVRARINGCPNVESSRRSLAFRPPAACTNTAPIPLLPLDDGRPLTSPVTFRWTSVPGANEYRLYLQRGNAAPELVATTATDEAIDVAVPNGESRWFVEALVSGCPPTRSSPSRFRAVPEPNNCLSVAAPVISVPGQVSAGTDFTVQWSSVPGAESYLLTEFIGSTARTVAVDGQSATFSYPNTTSAPITYVYSVRGVDNDCNPAQAGAISAALGVTILPQRSAEASTVVGTSNTIQQVITIGPEFAGQSFNATPAQPWITVSPRTGVVPAGGIDLVVTADITGLPLGTSLGAVTLTFGSPGGSRVSVNNGPVTAPVSVSLVTPVTPTPKSTPPPDALIIPAVAHAEGINAQFQSDVRVSNTSPQTMKYQLTFIPSGEAGMTEGRQTTLDIAPGRTLALDDVLRSWFGTSTNSVLGSLEIRPLTQSSSTTSSAAVRGVPNLVTFASSRTFNQTPNGTFGTYIAAIPFANFVGRSTGTAAATVLSLQQIAQSSTYRTNLGLVEGSGNPVELLVSVFDTIGSRVTQFPVALTGGQHLQLGSFLAEREIQLEDGRLEVQVLSGTGRVTSYASVVNNATGDSLVVTPVALSQSGSAKYVLPGVAELSAGVPWQTDVRLFNAGDQPVTATMTLQSLNGNAPQQATVELAPRQVKQLDRILATLFGVTNDGGALHITTPNATNLIATARTFRPAGNGANFGQFIQAVTPNEAIALGSRPLQILQVEESPRFRSNIGIAEVSGQPAKVELTVVPPDAKVSARIEVDMGANQFRQLNSLLSSMGLTGTHNARVTVKVISGTGRVTAYAATIDSVTQDPTFIPAQ
jgi:parallel beta-helix repeat protein